MSGFKLLNGCGGLGGNVHRLPDHVQVTTVEHNPKIAAVNQRIHPGHTVVVGDAYQYLLDHAGEFDGVWFSPNCQSHTKMMKYTRHKLKRYPDMDLYKVIIWLDNFYHGKWVVENVVPYYEPLIKPTRQIGRHLFWSNFDFEAEDVKRPKDFINSTNLAGKKALMDFHDLHYEENIYYDGNHCPAQILRNCVHWKLGLQIFKQMEQLR